jgi:hypothetical protein
LLVAWDGYVRFWAHGLEKGLAGLPCISDVVGGTTLYVYRESKGERGAHHHGAVEMIWDGEDSHLVVLVLYACLMGLDASLLPIINR